MLDSVMYKNMLKARCIVIINSVGKSINQSINQSVIISVAKIAEAITKSTVAQLEDDARK